LLVRLREDAKTDDFKELYRTHAPVSEGKFGEGKQWHGLRRAWRRGLSKMRMQCWLVGTVLNYKRLAAALGPFWSFGNAVWVVLAALLKSIRRARQISRDLTHHNVPVAAMS
jgi:hypothetical protein